MTSWIDAVILKSSERIRYTVFNLKLYGKTHTFFIPLPPKENNRHGTIQ